MPHRHSLSNIPNFKTVNIIRPKDQKKNSGEIYVLVKSEIRPGVKYMGQNNSWLYMVKAL